MYLTDARIFKDKGTLEHRAQLYALLSALRVALCAWRVTDEWILMKPCSATSSANDRVLKDPARDWHRTCISFNLCTMMVK